MTGSLIDMCVLLYEFSPTKSDLDALEFVVLYPSSYKKNLQIN